MTAAFCFSMAVGGVAGLFVRYAYRIGFRAGLDAGLSQCCGKCRGRA
jgi:branched-subunit amino acid ABC-type transport system permease component